MTQTPTAMITQAPTLLIQRFDGVSGYVTVDSGTNLKTVLLQAEILTGKSQVAHRVVTETVIQGFSPA